MRNPPLFEVIANPHGHQIVLTDITLRDILAGMAMQGILAYGGSSYGDDKKIVYVAKESIEFADALLAELEKEKP